MAAKFGLKKTTLAHGLQTGLFRFIRKDKMWSIEEEKRMAARYYAENWILELAMLKVPKLQGTRYIGRQRETFDPTNIKRNYYSGVLHSSKKWPFPWKTYPRT